MTVTTLSHKGTTHLLALQDRWNLPSSIKTVGVISIHTVISCIKIPEALLALTLAAFAYLTSTLRIFSPELGKTLRSFSQRSYEYAACAIKELFFLAPMKVTTKATFSKQKTASSKEQGFFSRHKYLLLTSALLTTVALGYLYYYSYRETELSSLPYQQKKSLLDLFSSKNARFEPCKNLLDQNSEVDYKLSNDSCYQPETCCKVTFRTPSKEHSAHSSYLITEEETSFPCSSIGIVTCDLALTSNKTSSNRFLHFLNVPKHIRNTLLWKNGANPYIKS